MKKEKCICDQQGELCSVCTTELAVAKVIAPLKELVNDKTVNLNVRQNAMKFMAKIVGWER